MSWDILSKTNLQYLLTRLKEVTDSITRGHAIKNDSGTSLAQKDDMQFGGAYSHNDGTTTKVDIVREFNSASDVDSLTGEAAKGFQHTPDTVYRGRTASDIGFDKTGTSFNGTRVQDVLEEVDSRISGLVYVGSLDDLKTTGFYQHTVTGSSNVPSSVNVGSIISLIVDASTLGLVTQVLFYGNLSIYVRRFANGSWNSWNLLSQRPKTTTVYGTTNGDGVLLTDIQRSTTTLLNAVKLRTGNNTTNAFASVSVGISIDDTVYYFQCFKNDGTLLSNTQVAIEVTFYD